MGPSQKRSLWRATKMSESYRKHISQHEAAGGYTCCRWECGVTRTTWPLESRNISTRSKVWSEQPEPGSQPRSQNKRWGSSRHSCQRKLAVTRMAALLLLYTCSKTERRKNLNKKTHQIAVQGHVIIWPEDGMTGGLKRLLRFICLIFATFLLHMTPLPPPPTERFVDSPRPLWNPTKPLRPREYCDLREGDQRNAGIRLPCGPITALTPSKILLDPVSTSSLWGTEHLFYHCPLFFKSRLWPKVCGNGKCF